MGQEIPFYEKLYSKDEHELADYLVGLEIPNRLM